MKGAYITCDDALCDDCMVNHKWEVFEDWPAPLSIDGDDESDSCTHCCECGVLIEHRLTDDGYEAFCEAIRADLKAGKRNPVLVQQVAYYEPDIGSDALDRWNDLSIDKVWFEREDLRKYLQHI